MKKTLFIFVSIALIGQVGATLVTDDLAQAVAKGWSIENASAFGQLGAVTGVTAETSATGEVKWYVVTFDGGAAVVAPDNEIEPVIAIIPGSDGVIAEKSPLRAMLERDLKLRKENLKTANNTNVRLLSTNNGIASKWTRLAAIGKGLRMLNSSGNPATIVKWLDGWNSENKKGNVQTLRFWSQTDSPNYFSDESIFNFYTPEYASGKRACCGCVATAGASIMHYFRASKGNVISRECSVGADYKKVTLQTKGGEYDWSVIDNLDLKNGTKITLSESALDLLARVAYDCSVGCGMAYDLDGEGSSGSHAYNLQQSFLDVFNVKHAQLITVNGSQYGDKEIGKPNYAAGIYNQVRAGAPVSMSIEGHEVVACGYGIDSDEVEYTYVFMGWGGHYDAWYALPNIETKSTSGGGKYLSTIIDELVTAVAFDDKYIPVVGRLLDADGEPVKGENITLSTGETIVSDENGYWGVRVSPEALNYVTDKYGERHYYNIGTAAKTTSNNAIAASSWSAANPEEMEIVVVNPTVRVYDGDVLKSERSSLNRALEDASELSDPLLVVSNAVVLRNSVTIDFKCRIKGFTDDGNRAELQFNEGCLLMVDNGGSLSLDNVSFSGDVKKIEVATGGELVLAGPVDFGTLISEGAAICTADSTGLVLASADALPSGFAISCRVSTLADQQFGRWESMSFDEVTNIVSRIWSADDPEREIGGWANADGKLIWRQAETSIEAAAGWFVDANGHTNCYGRLERALERFETALNGGSLGEKPEFVFRHDNTLIKSFTITTNVTFRGENSTIALTNIATTAGFVVSNGTLTLRNLTFDGYNGTGLFEVRGGELILDDTQVMNVYGVGANSGAVSVYDGKAIIKNSVFDNCKAIGYYGKNAKGGAIYADGGCEVDIQGTLITNCYSASYGGAVYAAKGAKVGIRGNIRVRGNRCGSVSGYENNIYLVGANTEFKVEGELSGINSVGVSSPNRESGMVFAQLASGMKEEQIEHICDALCNDYIPELAVVDPNEGTASSGEELAWYTEPNDPHTEPENAVALVSGAGEPADGYYATIEGALNSIARDGATVTILKDCSLASSVRLDNRLAALKSQEGSRFTITRIGDNAHLEFCASALITNLVFCGCESGGDSVAEGTLLLVNGGKLTLADGVTIQNVYGRKTRADGAIVVYNGAELIVNDGVVIKDCCNYLINTSDLTGHGGAIMVEKSILRLNGGTIQNCGSYIYGGGIFAGNSSEVYISGKVNVVDNLADDGSESNLTISDNSVLHLCDKITEGEIGIRVGFASDTNVFGQVESTFVKDFTVLTNSAASFVNDLTGAYGCAVTNVDQSAMLLVWSKAIKSDGSFTDDCGRVYYVVGDIPINEIVVHPTDIAFKSIAIDSLTGKYVVVLTNMVRGCWYSLYTTNSLVGGFEIEGIKPLECFQADRDGEYSFEIPSIVPATYIRATAEDGVVIP